MRFDKFAWNGQNNFRQPPEKVAMPHFAHRHRNPSHAAEVFRVGEVTYAPREDVAHVIISSRRSRVEIRFKLGEGNHVEFVGKTALRGNVARVPSPQYDEAKKKARRELLYQHGLIPNPPPRAYKDG